MPTFLFKTEPGDYSFADLLRDRRTTWSGVANPGALIHLRHARKGDEVLVYHTGREKAIVGLARAASNPFEDPARPGTTPEGAPRFPVVDLTPVRRATTPLPLASMRRDPAFAGFQLLTHARLSVMPVPDAILSRVRALAGL